MDDVVQEMSRERQKSARIARESKAALARLTADHAAQTADLQHQLRETEALVDEAASATTPLYMWPSADGMRVLKSKYDQLHEAHVHLQAVVSRARKNGNENGNDTGCSDISSTRLSAAIAPALPDGLAVNRPSRDALCTLLAQWITAIPLTAWLL